MEKLVVIGGGGAGMFSAIVAGQLKPGKYETTIVSDEKEIYCRCTSPYIITKEAKLEEAIQPDSMITDYGVKLIHEKVIRIDHFQKIVLTNRSRKIPYDKLVIATGSRPSLPPIKGLHSPKVMTVRTAKDIRKIQSFVKKGTHVVVIGGGIIGVEMAGALDKQGVKTSIVEFQHQLLSGIADTEYTLKLHDLLEINKIKIYLESIAEEIKNGKKGSKKVIIKDRKTGKRKELEAEFIIIATGIKPNTEFLESCDMKLDKRGFIVVDDRMRTNVKDVYACGDCVSSKHAVTGEITPGPLASIAIQQSKIVGFNLAGFPIRYHGHTNACAFKTFNTEYAEVGLSEELARKKYKFVVTGKALTTHHYKDMKDTKPLEVKLIFGGWKMRLLGAQAYGHGTETPIEIASFAISQKLSILKLLRYNYASHPSLTPWPFMNPIIMATEEALGKIMSWFKKRT